MTNKLNSFERLTVYKIIYDAPIVFSKGSTGMPDIYSYKGEVVKKREEADVIRELDDIYFDQTVMDFIVNAAKCAREQAITGAAHVIKKDNHD